MVEKDLNLYPWQDFATKSFVTDKTDVKIINDTDLDTVLAPGMYYVYENSINLPENTAMRGNMLVSGNVNSTNNGVQRVQFFIPEKDNGNLYWRFRDGGSHWRAWEKVAKMSATVVNYHKHDPNYPPQGFSFSFANKEEIVPNTGLNDNNEYYYLISFMEDVEKVQLAIPLGFNNCSKIGIYRRNKRYDPINETSRKLWSDWTPVYEMPDLSSYATQNWVTNAISSSGLNVFTKNAPSKNEIDSFHSEIDFIMNTQENTLPTQNWGTLITIRGVALEASGTQFWLSDNGTFYVRAKQGSTLEWQGWHPLGAGGMTRQEIIDLINTEEW